MRKLLALVLVGSFAALTTGCAQISKEAVYNNRRVVKGLSEDRTVTESFTEHLHRITAVVDQDAVSLVDDWDLLMVRDRPSRLTRWHVR
ncbi:MAG: hypothetical protein GY778_29245 [bacterium]|nr:hypothetical protein [bacterium]